jgi:uncharacterized membrane protein
MMMYKTIFWIMGAVAVLFGLLTIKSGGQVLFGDDLYREAAGNYVPFVLWSNFIAGFFYMVAGIGILLRKPWSVWMSLLIAAFTLLVFAVFGLHILADGAYETRTVAAMSLRSTVWIVILLWLTGSWYAGEIRRRR